jgi:protein involved in polysaccharide export with SLBB domain
MKSKKLKAESRNSKTQAANSGAAGFFRPPFSAFRSASSGFRFPVSVFCFLLSAFCFQLSAWGSSPGFAELPPGFLSGANVSPQTNSASRINTAYTASQTNSPGASVVTTNGAAAGTTNSMDALDDKYTLAIGDRLSFRIVEDEEDPKPLFVTDSGDLEVPYIGRFPAVGKTCKELAYALKAELQKEYYKKATVIVAVDLMTKSRGKVYVVGPVRAPGPQEIPSDEVLTLSKAILRAGGFGDFADRKNVKVTRKKQGGGSEDKTFTVNVADILEKGKTEMDLKLEPGDFIYVPERSIRF